MRIFLLLVVLVFVPAIANAGPRTIRATLRDDNKPIADCGGFAIWTVLTFALPKPIRVAVPCAELTRPQYSKTAGNAGVLVKGKSYVLTLDDERDGGPWGAGRASPALRIDNL